MKWKHWTNEMGISAVGPDGKNPVCKVYRGEHLNLIAAAPELLAALESVITWAERHKLNLADCIDGKQRECPVIMDARAAIAKARGA